MRIFRHRSPINPLSLPSRPRPLPAAWTPGTTPAGTSTQPLPAVRQIFPRDLDAIFLLSSNTSVPCRDPRGAMLLSTLPPRWERHLQGLENPGLLRIGAGQARHAGGLIQGIGQ